jgi:hypothetical protein
MDKMESSSLFQHGQKGNRSEPPMSEFRVRIDHMNGSEHRCNKLSTRPD